MPIASNTVALYNLNNALTDSSGNSYTLTNTGSVPFATSPTPVEGTHEAGSFGGTSYLSPPAGFTAAMNGKTAWTVEGYLYATSLANGPIVISLGCESSGAVYQNFRILSTGALRVINNASGFADSSTGLVTTGAWFFFFFQGTNTYLRAGVSPAASPDATVDVTLAADATVGNYQTDMGNYRPQLNTFNFSGYLDAVRFSDTIRTSFPTADSVYGGSAILRRRRR